MRPPPPNPPSAEKLRLWEDEVGWEKIVVNGERWRCGGMDGGVGRAGAHYSDGDLREGESTRCRQ